MISDRIGTEIANLVDEAWILGYISGRTTAIDGKNPTAKEIMKMRGKALKKLANKFARKEFA